MKRSVLESLTVSELRNICSVLMSSLFIQINPRHGLRKYHDLQASKSKSSSDMQLRHNEPVLSMWHRIKIDSLSYLARVKSQILLYWQKLQAINDGLALKLLSRMPSSAD